MTSTSDAPAPHTWDLYSHWRRRWFLFVLFLVSLSSQFDQSVVRVLVEPIKREFHATDTMMGGLTGFAFATCFALVALPAARLSDRGDRRIVIAACVVVWSVMTVFCGFARSFWTLAAARVGVGVGEAGAGPASGSLVGDYFPPTNRGGAIAASLLSTAVGGGLAAAIGAALAEKYGWRSAFLVMGAPGLLVAALSYVALSEPRRRMAAAAPATTADGSMVSTLIALARKRTFVLLIVALTLFTAMASGLGSWVSAYTMRTLGLSLTKAGASVGLASAGGSLIGTVGGGLFADILARRDVRWLFRLPGMAMLATLPFWLYAFMTTNFSVFIWILVVGNIVTSAVQPAMLSGLQMVIHSRQRATALALVGLIGTFLGAGLGPLMTGALSDALAPALGAQSLRYAMLATMMLLLPTGLATFSCARTLQRDRED